MFTPADQSALIAGLGEAVTINGTVTIADFRTESTPVAMFDGSVMSSTPVARITAAEYAAGSVTYGSTIIARSTTYTVAAIRLEQSGLYLLTLTK